MRRRRSEQRRAYNALILFAINKKGLLYCVFKSAYAFKICINIKAAECLQNVDTCDVRKLRERFGMRQHLVIGKKWKK